MFSNNKIKKLKQRINTLENDNEVLTNKVLKIILDKFGEEETTKKLRASNRKLRLQNKQLKEQLNEKRNTR